MRKTAYSLLIVLFVLAGIALPQDTQEISLPTTMEGFVRSIDGEKKMFGVSVKRDKKRWYRIPFARIKAVYLIPEKSETWPEWASRVAKRRELPGELAVYDPGAPHVKGSDGDIDYGNFKNLETFLQPGKSYVRVTLRDGAALQ